MKRRMVDWVLLLGIMGVSVVVFLCREQVQELGNRGYGGLFLLCFLSNCTVFLPAPSLMVVVSFAQAMNPLAVATVGAVGTALGELTGYAFGHAGQNVSERFRGLSEALGRRVKNDYVLVFLLALLPLPLFDLAGVYAGGSRLDMKKFFAACLGGKWLKMLFYAAVVGRFLDLALSLVA